jgi:hypothetical protein
MSKNTTKKSSLTLKGYYQKLDGRSKFLQDVHEATGYSIPSVKAWIWGYREINKLAKKEISSLTGIPIENL